MHKIHLLIQAVLILLLTSTSRADHNMIPCDYFSDMVPNFEISEKIFDSLLNAKTSLNPKSILAYLRLAPSFDPEVVFTITSVGSEFFIQKHTASDNIFGSIQLIAHQNNIGFNEIPNSIDLIRKSLDKSISFTKVEKKVNKELAIHILENFNFQLANSRNPTETEASQIFIMLDGYHLIFKSSSQICFLGLPTMKSPANQLNNIVILLTELFETTDEKSDEVAKKIMSITLDNKKNF